MSRPGWPDMRAVGGGVYCFTFLRASPRYVCGRPHTFNNQIAVA